MRRPRVYLAGPDVFLPEAAAHAAAKQRLCAAHGFTGVSPVDNSLSPDTRSPRQAARAIAEANESMIRSCQLVIANLTPFRGPGADPGTAYEMGYARALGLPVFGYTNVAGGFADRTRAHLGGEARRRATGPWEDGQHLAIEDFDLVDNLMLACALLASGTDVVVHPAPPARRFVDLGGFEACLRLAADRFRTRAP